MTHQGSTFSLVPTGDLLDLAPGEARFLEFDYIAIDGTGSETGHEPEQSLSARGEIAIWGALDAADPVTRLIVFETQGQSQHYTGVPADAAASQPVSPDFFGLDENASFSQKFGDQTFENGAVSTVIEGISSVASAIASLGCEIRTLGLGDCDINIPSSITLPSVTLDISVDARIGIEPVFQLGSGTLDSMIPVEVSFIGPQDIAIGSPFVIGTGYTLNPGTTQSTLSACPTNLTMGLDLIFDLDTGEQRLNLFSIASDGDPQMTSDFGPDHLLRGAADQINDALSNFNPSPVISFPEDTLVVTGDAGDGLAGSREEDFFEMITDLDAIVSSTTGVPLSLGYTIPRVSFDVLPDDDGGGTTLFKGSITVEPIEADLSAAYTLLQDFRLDVTNLPIVVTFEDGTTIESSLGQAIIVREDDLDTGYDFGDRLDYTVDVDMKAVFDSLATIGFDLQLFVGILRGQVSIESDYIPDIDINLFETPPALDSDGRPFPAGDGYAVGQLIELIDDDDGPVAYRNRDFDAEGWIETTGADSLSDSILIV